MEATKIAREDGNNDDANKLVIISINGLLSAETQYMKEENIKRHGENKRTRREREREARDIQKNREDGVQNEIFHALIFISNKRSFYFFVKKKEAKAMKSAFVKANKQSVLFCWQKTALI